MAYPKLLDLARQAAFENEEQGDHKTQRYLYHAIQITKRLNFDVLRNIKTVELKVRANKTIAFPDDYVSWVRIGVVEDGMVQAMCENLRMNILPNRAIGVSTGQLVPLSVVNNQVVGRVFGGANLVNPYGEYKIDQERKQIAFSSDLEAETIQLDYISTGIELTAETQVHPFAEETVLAYLRWKIMVPKRNIGLGEKQVAEEEFKRQNRLLQQRMRKFSPRDFLAAVRSGYTLSPKN